MEGAGNGFAGQNDVRERVRRDAAERGATHVVFVAAHDEEDRTPAQYHTRCRKGSCSTTTSGDYRFSRPHAGYLLVKVPRRNPAQLPLALGGRGASPGVRQPSRSTVVVITAGWINDDRASPTEARTADGIRCNRAESKPSVPAGATELL